MKCCRCVIIFVWLFVLVRLVCISVCFRYIRCVCVLIRFGIIVILLRLVSGVKGYSVRRVWWLLIVSICLLVVF